MSPAMEDHERLIMLQERIAVAEQRAAAAHHRIDKMEVLFREALDDIKEGSKQAREEVKELTDKITQVIDFMNRGKGWAAAGLFIAAMFGWILQKILTAIFSIK